MIHKPKWRLETLLWILAVVIALMLFFSLQGCTTINGNDINLNSVAAKESPRAIVIANIWNKSEAEFMAYINEYIKGLDNVIRVRPYPQQRLHGTILGGVAIYLKEK